MERKGNWIWGLKRLFIVAALCFSIFCVFCSGIASKYDVSAYYVAKAMMRQGTLSLIRYFTLAYDPVSAKVATAGPGDEAVDVGNKDCLRIEDYFEALRLHGQCGIRIIKIDNEKIIKSSFTFSYQPYDEPILHEVRTKFMLNEVVAPAGNEFEKLILLRNWTRSQFKRSDYQPVTQDFNALEILTNKVRNLEGKAWEPGYYNPCSLFPRLYAQLLLSIGHQARIVQISHGPHGAGHGMTEVWSNQFGKWVTMDVDLNLHYEADGIPLNMLEVHNKRYTKGPSSVKVIRGVQESGDFEYEKQIDIEEMIQYHSYIKIADMRNDWITNHYFRGHPKRTDRSSLFWVDKNLQPSFNFMQKTDNIDDFYWTLNQTEILVKTSGKSKNVLELVFKTFTPNFKHFEITVDDSDNVISTSPLYKWELHSGRNKLYVRSVNKFGVSGIPSFVEIMVDQEA